VVPYLSQANNLVKQLSLVRDLFGQFVPAHAVADFERIFHCIDFGRRVRDLG